MANFQKNLFINKHRQYSIVCMCVCVVIQQPVLFRQNVKQANNIGSCSVTLKLYQQNVN